MATGSIRTRWWDRLRRPRPTSYTDARAPAARVQSLIDTNTVLSKIAASGEPRTAGGTPRTTEADVRAAQAAARALVEVNKRLGEDTSADVQRLAELRIHVLDDEDESSGVEASTLRTS
jgi:hypothetical protein